MVTIIKTFIESLNDFPKDKFPPEVNTPPYVRAYIFANYALINGALAHALFLIIFAILSIKILAIFNILSVILWLMAFTIFRKGYFWQGITIVSIELIAHAFLCVIVIGWDAGFQYYVFTSPIFIFLSPWKTYVKALISLLFILTYMAMSHYAYFVNPYVELSSYYLVALHYMNIINAMISPIIGIYAYYRATIRVEEKLEIEHKKTNRALSERNKALSQLNSELTEAAEYVKTILPQTLTDSFVKIDWRFIPSTSLGGDAFGYHTIDDDHLAIYIIDVSGHGVGAALLSVSVINVLRSHSLPKTDFKDPGQVLRSLNLAFPSESNKGMFFTMWYGVYNQNTRELTYASAGHPPAILCGDDPSCECQIDLLRTPNNVVGGMSESMYQTERCFVGDGSTLYVFSDGVYEVERQDGSMWRYQEFTDYMQKIRTDGHEVLDRLYGYVRELGNSETLEDDFTILEVAFT